MKTVPFWVDDYPRPEGLTSPPPDETDYLVVGSGLTGLSVARRLLTSGSGVTIIDQGEIAGGASSMNGGMVSGDVKAGMQTVLAYYGPRVAFDMWSSSARSVDLVREVAKDPTIDAVVDEGGMATVGRGSRDLKVFDRTVEWYRNKYAVDWHVVDARQIASIIGGDHFNVALLQPEGFGVHPARLVFGLARRVGDAGAILVDHCGALSMRRTQTGFVVDTTLGQIEAGDVILATNGYTTRQPSKELARLIVPVGSYIIATEPLGPETVSTIFPGGAMTHTRKRLLNYMRRSHDNRIIFGGRRSLQPDLDLVETAQDLRSRMVELWPELAGAEVTHAWGGRIGVPFDLMPHIGRIEGAWYAMGYAGHGVGLSMQLGHELAGMLLGEDPPSVFSQIPHNGRFYYSGNRAWFLSPGTYLYRVLDHLGI